MTLAPTRPAAFVDDALAPSTKPSPRTARSTWWQWLDFDSELRAQVWVICCAQILLLAVAGLVIHASAVSPY